MFRIIWIATIHLLSINLGSKGQTQYVLINKLSIPSENEFAGQPRVDIYKVNLQSSANLTHSVSVFNIFYIPEPLRISDDLCKECFLELRDKDTPSKMNRLFVSFSILSDKTNGKIIKKPLSEEQVLSMPVISLQSFREEVVSRLKQGIFMNTNRSLSMETYIQSLPKTMDYKVIVKENGKYYLYDSPTLAEFYRIAESDEIYYPIDNDNVTINPIARIFSLSEFREIFQNGVPHADDGNINESDKTRIDRYRLSGKIFRDNNSELANTYPNTSTFWNAPLFHVRPLPDKLSYSPGITTFDFNKIVGIIGGGYNFYFDTISNQSSSDNFLLNKEYNEYFKVSHINDIPVKDFIRQYNLISGNSWAAPLR